MSEASDGVLMLEIRGLTVLGVLMMAYQGSRTSIDSDGVLMPAVNLNLLCLYVDISGSKGDT